jgi:uncharacterized protein (TIRG00374 family)
MSPRAKKWLSNGIRVAVSVGILYWIFSQIQLKDHAWSVKRTESQPDGQVKAFLEDASGKHKEITVWDFPARSGEWIERGIVSVFGTLQLGWILAAAGVFWMAPALQAFRWRRLLSVQDVHLPIGTVFKLMWVGMFFNLFLLGAVGGDLIKAYYVSHHAARSTGTRAESVVTVLVDRLIGLVGLVWLSAAAMLAWVIWHPGGELRGGLPWLWLTPGVVVLVFGGVFFSAPLRNLLGINKLIGRLGENHMVRRLDRAVYLYRTHKLLILEAFGWTFASHVCLIATIYFILRAFGIDALPAVVIFTPLILIATGIIPAIGGLGVQEYGFVLFFAALKGADGIAVGLTVALAASLIYRLVNITWSLPGAVVMMLGTHMPSRAEMERDMEQP